jgi:site-specific recombinase XerD
MENTMLDELFEKFDGAFAENTIRAYKSDFNHFSQWCFVKNIDPLKTTGDDWKDYIEYCAENLSTATVRRRIDSLSSIFKLVSLQCHADHPEVVLALKRMHRKKGRAQKQAEPLTIYVRDKLLAVCTDDTRGMRNRVLLMLGYETMRRRSELCNFRFDNLQTLPNGKKAIFMAKSKTDQYGQGRLLPITDELYDLLNDWQNIVGNGYILRGINQHIQFTKQLSPATINRILKQLQQEADLKLNQELSGHSFRVGRALDLLLEGEPFEKIMLRGGWRSESTTMRYLRAWQEI